MFNFRLGALGRAIAALGFVPAFSPASLFANGEQGAWYDPSDFSTMFQDRFGSVPVTAVGQTVGLILDKSKGLALGSQRVVNGTFAVNTANWTANSGCTIARDTTIFPDGGVALTANGTRDSHFEQLLSGLTIGRLYKISASAYSPSGQGFIRAIIGTESSSFTAAKSVPQRVLDTVSTIEIVFVATAPTQLLYCTAAWEGFLGWAGPGDVVYFDNISFQELAGNHATAPSDAARPVLRQDANGKYYLEFDGVDDSLRTAAFANAQPLTYTIGAYANSWLPPRYFYDGNTLDNVMIYQGAVSPNMRIYAGTLSPEFPVPLAVPNVITAIYNGASSIARVNAVQQAAGNAGAGASNGISLFSTGVAPDGFMGGRLYSAIFRGALSTAQQITDTETWVNSKTGAF